MSIIDFGMTTQKSFLNTPQMPIEHQLAQAEMLANRYETLSRLSFSLASLDLNNLPRNVAELLRPLLDFDFLDIIVFKEGANEVLWHSVGAGQLPTPDGPLEETTYWWVHQQQQPLCIGDWRGDERFAARRDALKKIGVEYRSLCRLPLRTPYCPLGVFSIASSRPHNYSQEEVQFLSLAADRVALAVAHALNFASSRRSQSELDVKSTRLRLLRDLTNGIAAHPDLDDFLREVTVGVRQAGQSDFAMVG